MYSSLLIEIYILGQMRLRLGNPYIDVHRQRRHFVQLEGARGSQLEDFTAKLRMV